MDASAKTTKKQEKGDVVEEPAAVKDSGEEENEPALAITVLSCDHKWEFHLDEDQPLNNTLFIPLEQLLGGKCMLHYESAAGHQILNRTKTPSFYGMIYDDHIYLGAVIRASD